MVRIDEAVVRVLKIRLQRDDCLGCQLFDLAFNVTNITPFSYQFFKHVRQQLLRRVVVVRKLSAGLPELV